MDFKDFKDKMHSIHSYTPDLIELNYCCFVCKRLHFHFFYKDALHQASCTYMYKGELRL